MIGDEVFNPKNNEHKAICRLNESTNSSIYNNGYWHTYYYDKKTREFRAFITSNQNYSYAKTSVYYFNGLSSRIVWLCRITASVQGKRLKTCDPNSLAHNPTFGGTSSVFASVVEKYQWYNYSFPNYLHPYNTPIVFSSHTAPGKSFNLSR
jgi:hypothetical protein